METKKQKLKELRRSFREQVFERDNNQCRLCNCKENLDAHHITNRNHLPMYGYVVSNGITLCPEHHLSIEQQDAISSDKLYEMIDSSFGKALSDCVKLEEVQ